MPLPIPTIDHVVVNVRDEIDAGAETWQRLGFTLTPRGYHTLGSMNHLAMFGTDYLELIAAPPNDRRRPEILDAPVGLNGVVFATEDSAATYAALLDAGVPVEPPQQFSRPVTLPDGPHDATFRTVRLTPGSVSAGRLYFCHHLTRDLVWRDEWRHHANGTIGVAGAVIAAQDPAGLAGLFAQMFGSATLHPIAGGCALAAGLADIAVVTPAALAACYGAAAPDGGGRNAFMAVLRLRTRSLDAAEAALTAGGVAGVQRSDAEIVVPAASAFGVTLVFVP